MDGSCAVRAHTVKSVICSPVKLYHFPVYILWLKQDGADSVDQIDDIECYSNSLCLSVFLFLTFSFLLLSILSLCPCLSFSLFNLCTFLSFLYPIHLLNAVVALTFLRSALFMLLDLMLRLVLVKSQTRFSFPEALFMCTTHFLFLVSGCSFLAFTLIMSFCLFNRYSTVFSVFVLVTRHG